ncbi:MAG TPA: hypothetical protein VF176_01765 [Solirubrobacterales bacterium]
MRLRRNLIAVLGVVALAVPAAAIANNGENHGKGKANGHAKTHDVAYVFKGTYAGGGSVDVLHGNSRVRKGGFVGQTVAFDLSDARIVVADTNQDGTRNLDDVQTGDKVVVKARLPRTDPGDQPFDAKRLIDQTHSQQEV